MNVQRTQANRPMTLRTVGLHCRRDLIGDGGNDYIGLVVTGGQPSSCPADGSRAQGISRYSHDRLQSATQMLGLGGRSPQPRGVDRDWGRRDSHPPAGCGYPPLLEPAPWRQGLSPTCARRRRALVGIAQITGRCLDRLRVGPQSASQLDDCPAGHRSVGPGVALPLRVRADRRQVGRGDPQYRHVDPVGLAHAYSLRVGWHPVKFFLPEISTFFLPDRIPCSILWV